MLHELDALDLLPNGGLRRLAERWQNCSQGIYLDVGSNYGVQIRKLYRPQQFPAASVLPIFDRRFGTNRSRVCAVGFEPNKAITSYLETVNDWFHKHSYQALFFVETAVSNYRKENVTFHRVRCGTTGSMLAQQWPGFLLPATSTLHKQTLRNAESH